jgi:DNA-binding transcriptional LysR family regulator
MALLDCASSLLGDRPGCHLEGVVPRIEELITLCKVIEQKSFSRAAELLELSQPAVSLQIKSLESEYGVELLHRDGFEIVPTESGYLVYEAACQIVDIYVKSGQQVRELGGNLDGSLLVGASTGPGECLLPLLLGRFKIHYPQVSVALRVGDSSEIIDKVVKHRLDLGFVGTSRRDRHLCFEPFVHDQLVLVVVPNHPWAARSFVSYEEFLQAPLILQQHGSGATAALYETLSEYNINVRQLNVIMELGLQESTKAAVKSGLGMTIISKLGVIGELNRGDLVEVPIEGIELKRDFYVVYRRTSPLTNLARTFIEYAQSHVKQVILQIQSDSLN